MTDKNLLIALYENRKQFLLVNYRIHGQKCGFNESYIYAISHDMYPLFDQDYSLNEEPRDPYSDCYKISGDEVADVLKYIDDEWLGGNVYDFYTLERHFGGKEYRLHLICILRYCYLDKRFDKNLWDKLVENAPIEAKSITRELAEWEI